MSEPRHPKLNIKFDTQKARRAGSLTRDAAQNPSSASARSPLPAQVEGLELLPCPFCGNKAVIYPSPDNDRNIISCRLGHAPMRTVEGWNTRTDSTKAKVEKLEAVARQMMKALRNARDMKPDEWDALVTPDICSAWTETAALIESPTAADKCVWTWKGTGGVGVTGCNRPTMPPDGVKFCYNCGRPVVID